jgi:hypothetical protein
MWKARQGPEAPRIISQSSQPLTKCLNDPIKRGKNAVMKVFFTQFIPDMLDGVDFGTVRGLRDQPDIRLR